MKNFTILITRLLLVSNIVLVSSQLLNDGPFNTDCPLGPLALSLSTFRNTPRSCIDTPQGTRCYYTYVPRCASDNAPLIFDLHGWMSCPLYSRFYTGWKKIADDFCAVVVWPIGNVREDETNNSCWAVPNDIQNITSNPHESIWPCCCGKDDESVSEDETGDLSYLRSVAAQVVRDVPETSKGQVSINTRRIYMAGHSNGCMMSFAMAMKQSDMVAAVCCHAGVLLSNPTDDYDPRPIWFVHGERDDILPYERLENAYDTGTLKPGAQDVFDYLSNLNGCSRNSTVEFEGGYTQEASDCINDANVEFMTITNAEHFLFTDIENIPFVDFEGTEKDTTLAAWEFCSGYELSENPDLDDI